MEPERRIEKWLRAFANKRREQAGEPMELRPADRERLQREIARQSEEKRRGFFSGFFFGPRLRLVFAACFAAIVLGTLLLWPPLIHHKPTDLAMNKSSYSEIGAVPVMPETPPPAVMSPTVASADKKVLQEKQNPIPTAPAPAPPTVVAANRSLATPPPGMPTERDRAESVSQQKQLTVTTAAASGPSTNLALAFKNDVAAGSLANADEVAKGALPTTAAPQSANFLASTLKSDATTQTLQSTLAMQRAPATTGSNVALFDLAKATGPATVSQVFYRLQSPATRRATATAPVLISFRVEQSGNNLKVVDGDGSVYTGSVQIAQQEPPADTSFAPAKNAPIGAARAAKAPAPKPQNYFFRVAGTNRALNENIVFSGNFVPFTNNQPVAGISGFGGFAGGGGGGGGGPVGARDQAAGQPVQAILSNSQINGNVVIGSEKPINVIATPAH